MSHWLSRWPKKSPNLIFTTKTVFPKSLEFMNSGSEEVLPIFAGHLFFGPGTRDQITASRTLGLGFSGGQGVSDPGTLITWSPLSDPGHLCLRFNEAWVA